MDNDNVFAPGADSAPLGSAAPGGEPAPVDLMALFERTWRLMLDNLAVVGLAAVLFFGIGIAGGGISFALNLWGELAEDDTTKLIASLINLVVQIGFGLFQLFFQLGLLKMLLGLDRGESAELDMLWSQGDKYLSAVGATILIGLATFFGFLLLIVPGIIVGLGLSMTLLIIIDRNSDPISALSESWELTDGHKMFLFIQGLCMGLIGIAAYCFTCGLATPLISAGYAGLQAVTYNALLHHKARSA